MLPGDGVAGYARDFGRPDETAHYDHAVLEIIEFGDVTVGRITARPGWRWSEHMRPVVGGDWCEARHVGLVLRGQFGFTFRNGTSIVVGTDQVFDVPGGHDGYTVGDEDCVLLEWAGVRATTGFSLSPRHRMLTTLLFTDLVGSTEHAARLGDQAWHDLLATHYEGLRAQLERFGGREVETTGDGMLATFSSTAAALQCAAAVVQEAGALGLHVRAGVHVGEVHLVGAKVRGLAVHEAARIMALAGTDEVLTSETARVLAAGPAASFADRGLHLLKGLDGERRLFAYLGGGESA